MIPASILLIILVLADAVSHITLWLRSNYFEEKVVADLKERIRKLEEAKK